MCERVNRFLVDLLGRRSRRIPILYRWNTSSAPCKGDTVENVVDVFINILLYSEICLEMTHLAIYPFGISNGHGLSIPFTWLTCRELETVKWIHCKRTQLFRCERRHPNKQENFVLQDVIGKLTLSIQHRRELVRDFVGMCLVQKNPEISAALHYALLLAVHKMIHSKVQVDAFIIGILRLLNGLCTFDQVLCVI